VRCISYQSLCLTVIYNILLVMKSGGVSFRGFTIVELLVVIVVIGVLAAISVVSYFGISQKASVATVQSDLNNASKQLGLYSVEHGSYPTNLDNDNCPILPVIDNDYCIKLSGSNSLSYRGSYSSYNLVVAGGGNYYKITNDSGISAVDSLEYGLAAHYDFNNDIGTNLVDSSGNAFNGTVPASVAHIANGSGQAIEFDASAERATLPLVHSFTDNIIGSYSFWFKSSSTATSNKYIYNSGVSRLDVNFETSTQKIFVWYTDPTNTGHLVWKSSTSSYINGAWHFVAVVKSATRINVYLDNVDVGGYNTTDATYSNNTNSYIGQDGFYGSFDDLRVYDRELSASELQLLFSNGAQ
jgi:prepilin-type N-terminal cleavage/methylation domain-containing protein